MESIPDNTRSAEAARLKQLFAKHAGMSQAEFGRRFEVGSAGMVWQYLNAHRPLNLSVASKFARGLGVAIGQFSPRLAERAKEISEALEEVGPAQALDPRTALASAAHDVDDFDKNFALDDVLRHFPTEDRQRILDEIAAKLVRARPNFTEREFTKALDLLQGLDGKQRQPKSRAK